MRSNIVIKVDSLSKQYRLGNVGLGSLGADVNRFWQTKIRGKEDPYLKIGEENNRETIGGSEYVWALRDINFDVQQGEVLGIIGRNGAGKSTLLKILSRTTGPTTGSIKIKGRVASLLEVGTGFHPELTGRENIFLNGAILGMTKHEIKSKFDEIVDFAGVERYVDTPVKRYSSGMYVRLAFAVAAHLEPEILIVDEVLAVGDAEFQKKAIGKMKDVSQGQGRTVLFVSHNMVAIKSLCEKTILLTNGIIESVGASDEIVGQYLATEAEVESFKKLNACSDDGQFNLLEVGVRGKDKSYTDTITEDESIQVTVKFENNYDEEKEVSLTLALKGPDREFIASASSAQSFGFLKKGNYCLVMSIPSYYFNHGRSFYIDVLVVTNSKNVVIWESDVVSFFVNPEEKPFGSWYGKSKAYIRGLFEWHETTSNEH